MVSAILLMLVTLLYQHTSGQHRAGVKSRPRPKQSLPRQCAIPSRHTPFTYNPQSPYGPRRWAKMSTCCTGEWQSPINIATSYVMCNQPQRLTYSIQPVMPVKGIMMNNGHTVTLNFNATVLPILSGIPYWEKSQYVLSSLHSHCGSGRGRGSEHTINNVGYDGELHIIHYKREYGSEAEAVKHLDGLVVVNIFLQEYKSSTNSDMDRLIKNIRLVQRRKMFTRIPYALDVRKLYPWSKDFYAYHGSLTTPPCSESVRWIVMREPVLVSQATLNVLRNTRMADGSLLSRYGNIRPLRGRARRQVTCNFPCE